MQFTYVIFDGLDEHVIYELVSYWSNLEASLFDTYKISIKKAVNTLILVSGKNDIDASSTYTVNGIFQVSRFPLNI